MPRGRKRTGASKACRGCGVQFYSRPSFKNKPFCSWPCYQKFRATVRINCETCGKSVKPKSSKTRFCSYKCSKTGPLNPQWKGGKPGRERHYKLDGIHWRELVYKRDNFTCKTCKQRGGRIAAHHMDAYAWCVERRADVSNGVTLCVFCHKDFHGIHGIGKNTEVQFKEYLLSREVEMHENYCIALDVKAIKRRRK